MGIACSSWSQHYATQDLAIATALITAFAAAWQFAERFFLRSRLSAFQRGTDRTFFGRFLPLP
jgi:hypothetical protein